MATLVYGLNQTLDGYVDHDADGIVPDPVLFQHFIDEAKRQDGCLYGRTMYETMRYWDEDQTDWGDAEWAFASAWRAQPKWVVSRTLEEVGPNATLIRDDLERAVRAIKAEHDGEIEVAGPLLAKGIDELGLIDLFRIYLHPVVVGSGKTYFRGPRPPLRLIAHERIGEKVLRLTYVPD